MWRRDAEPTRVRSTNEGKPAGVLLLLPAETGAVVVSLSEFKPVVHEDTKFMDLYIVWYSRLARKFSLFGRCILSFVIS